MLQTSHHQSQRSEQPKTDWQSIGRSNVKQTTLKVRLIKYDHVLSLSSNRHHQLRDTDGHSKVHTASERQSL